MSVDPLSQVTPLILTHNEEVNIERTLAGLHWADRIVVIDSGSNDRTLELLSEHPCVQIYSREFDSFANQCNYGLSLIETTWCLSLDADHVVTAAFQSEMEKILAEAPAELTAVLTSFTYVVFGRPLSSALLPARYNLIQPRGGVYKDDGHAHQFVPLGATTKMSHPLLHDDRKPLDRWLAAQQRYLKLETVKLLNTPARQLSRSDRLRRSHVIAPFAVLFFYLICCGGIRDGWRGWFYALQRMYAETLLSLMLLDAKYNCRP